MGERFRISATVAAAVVFLASPSMADNETVGVTLYARGGTTDLGGKELSQSSAGPSPEILVLRSDSSLAGGGASFTALVGRWRFGVDLGAHAFPGAEIEAWGLRMASFGGYEILAGPVYPYVDLVLSMSLLLADVDEAHYSRVDPAFGPRAGVLVPITSWAMVDVNAYHPIAFGHERLMFTAGLSFWLNKRSDAHTSRLRKAD